MVSVKVMRAEWLSVLTIWFVLCGKLVSAFSNERNDNVRYLVLLLPLEELILQNPKACCVSSYASCAKLNAHMRCQLLGPRFRK
jgi:hypothetical protein